MIKLHIDGRETEVESGGTVLDAARQLGIEIPTLCYLPRCGPLTSCLACVVKIQGRLVPSCATKAEPGMRVESESDDVREARRTALELLLSDHVGDCLSPCHRICPLGLNVPMMIRHIEADQLRDANQVLRGPVALAGLVSRLCHRPCENGCRRGVWDSPSAIRDLEQHAADAGCHISGWQEKVFAPLHAKRVAVVGGGPVGLAAAHYLRRQGFHVQVYDRGAEPGGSLLNAAGGPGLKEALQAELAILRAAGVVIHTGVALGVQIALDPLSAANDAVLLAVGESAAQQPHMQEALPGARVAGEPGRSPLFRAGSMVKPIKQFVRAVAEGQAIATTIAQHLSGTSVTKPPKPFSSIMGKVERSEVAVFMELASREGRIEPQPEGYTVQDAIREAARCLHCDCRAVGECWLQEWGEKYNATPNYFGSSRRDFAQETRHGEILYESGKCIRCGICIKIAEQSKEMLGLAFIGRGFDVEVKAPLNEPLTEGLKAAAADCADHCPTGALVRRPVERIAEHRLKAGTTNVTWARGCGS